MANFFKLTKHKSFNYTPRFYNEREEQKKERQSRILKEIELERNGKARESEGIGSHYIKFARKTRKKSNIRLIVILGALILLYYFLMMR